MTRVIFIIYVAFAFGCVGPPVFGQSSFPNTAAKDLAQILQDLSQNEMLANFLRTNNTGWFRETAAQIQKIASTVQDLILCIESISTPSNKTDPTCLITEMTKLAPLFPQELFNSSTQDNVVTGLTQMLSMLETGLSNLTNPQEFFARLQYLTNDSNGTDFLSELTDLAAFVQSQLTNNSAIQTFMSGLSAISYSVSPVCGLHLLNMVGALSQQEEWAMRMIDAGGKLGAGVLDGNWVWLGSYDECVDISTTLRTGADIAGKYCLANIPVPAPMPPEMQAIGMQYLSLSLGMCVPSSCMAEDISGLLYTLSPMKDVPAWAYCQEKPEFTPQAIAMIVVSSTFAFIILLATAYDVALLKINKYLKKMHGKIVEKSPIDVPQGIANGGFQDGDVFTKLEGLENIHMNENADVAKPHEGKPNIVETEVAAEVPDGKSDVFNMTKFVMKLSGPMEVKPGILGKMLLAFSLYTNIPKLLSTQQSSSSLRAVNGIRFLSMTWVILGHTYSFTLSPFNFGTNTFPFFNKMMHRFSFMAIANALVGVDTFFTLSGLLVTYLSLKELKKRNGIKRFNWGLYYFHRFWRLTPAYMLFLGLYISLAGYLSDGPIWPGDAGFSKDHCKNTWWTNLLYVNNFVRVDDQTEWCMGWTWYLANDMQFFVLTPLFLIPLYLSGIVGMIVCTVFLGVVSTITGVLSAQHDYPASMVTGGMGDDGKYFQNIYIKPYCRMGPYIIGIMTGYILYRTKCRIRMPKVVVVLGWLAAAGINLSVLYGLYDPDRTHVLSTEVAAFYNAMHRTGWAVGVCWVVVACATGYGGVVNRILSWSAMVPLSRLSYCAYLVHPVLIFVYYFSIRVPFHFTDYGMIYLFLGNVVLTYMVAFCVSLGFESPMMGLEKVIFRRGEKK